MPNDIHRGVAREGAGWAEPPRNLSDQLTLFKPWGTDYARNITASPHRSVVDYLAQVKRWKNYPTLFDGVFS